MPRRHVEGLDALTRAEAVEMGVLLHDASAALVEVTGCQRTYVMLFAETEGYAHLHLHVVPRQAGPRWRTGGQASSLTWVRRRTSEFPRRRGICSPHASVTRWSDSQRPADAPCRPRRAPPTARKPAA